MLKKNSSEQSRDYSQPATANTVIGRKATIERALLARPRLFAVVRFGRQQVAAVRALASGISKRLLSPRRNGVEKFLKKSEFDELAVLMRARRRADIKYLHR
jgi:hypothetical protein